MYVSTSVCLDVISSYPLHPASPSEEGPLLHRASDDPADHRVCIWDASPALHEDGLPSSDDPSCPRQVRRPRPMGGRVGPA